MSWGEFGGLYHTYTRHREQFWLTVAIPPVSWYRSIEMFWDKEYSGKRWEKTQFADAQMLAHLLYAYHGKDTNRAELLIPA